MNNDLFFKLKLLVKSQVQKLGEQARDNVTAVFSKPPPAAPTETTAQTELPPAPVSEETLPSEEDRLEARRQRLSKTGS